MSCWMPFMTQHGLEPAPSVLQTAALNTALPQPCSFMLVFLYCFYMVWTRVNIVLLNNSLIQKEHILFVNC